ncbi:hypothetical protein SAMN05192533_10683 [Mesobacillus persicus]|uniref:Uncharacterized protein n=1 Tax=Mesobacillus persicus TaxID=930146 RepID=A0A1H8BLE6_9BACI|nr:hypothetical protein [Mesobacillus persicus]SEM83616.1 hypothetical protein SAMN05192533_10683 [Mesobacillus persicus]
MNTTGIEKEKIIMMLTELNNQLDELEVELHSSTEEVSKVWYDSQDERLSRCDQKLEKLEGDLIDMEQGTRGNRKSYPGKRVVKLELGY